MKRLLTLVGICLALTTFAQEKVQRVERDIGSDHFAAGDALVLDKPVAGDLIAAGGKVLIDGVVDGDVEARAGTLTLGPSARITGKLRYASRDDLIRDPAAQVQGALERRAVPGGWPMPDDMERGMGRGGGWVWTTGLLVVAAVWVLALPGFARRVAKTLRNRFPLSLLLGFALLVCIPVAAALFMVTIIGVPLALATLALYPVLLPAGLGALGLQLARPAQPA